MKHIPTFQEFINESTITMGNKVKKFSQMVDDLVDNFIDAADLEDDGKLPKEYYTALKTLGIREKEAMVCFSGAVGDWNKILDSAKKAGLTYTEVEDTETGDAAIVFSKNQ